MYVFVLVVVFVVVILIVTVMTMCFGLVVVIAVVVVVVVVVMYARVVVVKSRASLPSLYLPQRSVVLLCTEILAVDVYMVVGRLGNVTHSVRYPELTDFLCKLWILI